MGPWDIQMCVMVNDLTVHIVYLPEHHPMRGWSLETGKAHKPDCAISFGRRTIVPWGIESELSVTPPSSSSWLWSAQLPLRS